MYTVSDCDTLYYKGEDINEARKVASEFNADIFDENGEIVE